MNGIVNWFDDAKGFGFITPEKGDDVFVHYSDIQSNERHKTLVPGEQVSFEIGEGKEGKLRAVNVCPLEQNL